MSSSASILSKTNAPAQIVPASMVPAAAASSSTPPKSIIQTILALSNEDFIKLVQQARTECVNAGKPLSGHIYKQEVKGRPTQTYNLLELAVIRRDAHAVKCLLPKAGILGSQVDLRLYILPNSINPDTNSLLHIACLSARPEASMYDSYLDKQSTSTLNNQDIISIIELITDPQIAGHLTLDIYASTKHHDGGTFAHAAFIRQAADLIYYLENKSPGCINFPRNDGKKPHQLAPASFSAEVQVQLTIMQKQTEEKNRDTIQALLNLQRPNKRPLPPVPLFTLESQSDDQDAKKARNNKKVKR